MCKPISKPFLYDVQAIDLCSSKISSPSAEYHSLLVLTPAVPSASLSINKTVVQTIRPLPAVSLQKSTPLIDLSFDFVFSSSPSGITSPWPNQADF